MTPSIRRFRKSMATEFGVPEQTVDLWAKEGLAMLAKLRVSSDPVDRTFYQIIAKAFLPAYYVGFATFVTQTPPKARHRRRMGTV